MSPKDYVRAAARTDLNNYAEPLYRLFSTPKLVEQLHASIGMCGEAGEVSELVKKSLMYNKPIDREDVVKECGDILWYMSVMLRSIDASFEEVMQANIDKLQKRYPEKFTAELAIARKDEQT